MKRVGYLIGIAAVLHWGVEIHDDPIRSGWWILPLCFAVGVLIKQSCKRYC